MKRVNSSLFTVLSAILAVSACQREAAVADTQTPVQGEEMVIPVSVEGAISVEAPASAGDTKVSINTTTGLTAWDENDRIGIYISGTNANRFVESVVIDNSVRLGLATGQTRSSYAIYPYTGANSNAPRVVYPNSYDMGGKSVSSSNTWAPTPMVAVNTPGQELRFFHVGGLVRLHVTDIPSGTYKLEITFNGLSNLFGNFTVSNPGTPSATTTYSNGGSGTYKNVVTFTNLSIVGNEAYLNIPVPTKDFSDLTGIQVKATWGTGSNYLTVTKSISGWGSIAHGTGKKVDVGFVSISHTTGYNGRFRGWEIAKGYLVWDSTAGAYKLSDPGDPFLPLRYYGGDAADALNVVYHQWRVGANSLKARLEGNPTSTSELTVIHDGLVWSLFEKCYRTTTNYVMASGTQATINGSTGPYSICRVDLSGATSVGDEGYDYSGKGLSNASGAAVDTNDGGYQVGLLLIPDYTQIVCPGIYSGNASSAGTFSQGTALPWSTLKMFLDEGCVFLPVVGRIAYSDSPSPSWSWVSGGVYGYYWGSSISGINAYSTYMYQGSFVNSGTYDGGNNAMPVVLVRQ